MLYLNYCFPDISWVFMFMVVLLCVCGIFWTHSTQLSFGSISAHASK